MAKRKTFDDSANEDTDKEFSLEESPSGDEVDKEDEDEYNELRQEFEFFDPQPATDREGIARLLRQLFDSDASSFHLGAIADLILNQPTLGSTIKTDGHQSDPHAFLTVLNLKEHKDQPVIKQLIEYIGNRAATNPDLSPLNHVLGPSVGNEVGLILTERLINIATELVPPMYDMLLEEVSWAIDDKEPYTFTHYLIMSRTYLAVPSTFNEKTNRPIKKSKPNAKEGIEEGHSMYYFHPEDEVLQRHATLYGSFEYVKQALEGASDAKSTFHDFGIKTRGHLILIEAARFEAAVRHLQEEFRDTSTSTDATVAET
ncbi:MAG: hypothetical protein LQ352_004228 [Teloschistes flavicans]|nr:MAG: hypothetical protein LQ352_004228 [Teloschistes flavicans]